MRTARALLVLVPLLVATPAVRADHLLPNHAYLSRALGSPPLTFQRSSGFPQAEAIAYWNNLLVTPVFALVDGAADITITDAGPCQAGTDCVLVPVNGQPCVVVLSDGNVRSLAHELGHCLGFADHLGAANYAAQRGNDPKICDDGSSSYAGVMSACTASGNHDTRYDDADMLRSYGFATRTVEPLPTPDTCWPSLDPAAPALVQLLARILRRILCGV